MEIENIRCSQRKKNLNTKHFHSCQFPIIVNNSKISVQIGTMLFQNRIVMFCLRHSFCKKLLLLYRGKYAISHQVCSLSGHEHGDSKTTVRVRFAPSPTGFIHLGGLRTALFNYLFAKKHNGKFVLRIEDTDQKRLVPGAAAAIEEMLDWMGIEVDEGPSPGGDHGPYFQSQRKEIYREVAEQLIQSGHAYRCFCPPTRLEILRRLSRGGVGYDNLCRGLTQTEIDSNLQQQMPFVVRFKLEPKPEGKFADLIFGVREYKLPGAEGDMVILKSDSFPTYHLANVVDDHCMNISHVLRGEEWLTSTVKHVHLFNALGWDLPQYGHLPLLGDADGSKLSKRKEHARAAFYREQGYFPLVLANFVCAIGGGFEGVRAAEHHVYGMDELASKIDLHLVRHSMVQLDFNRLNIMNRSAIDHLSIDDRKTILKNRLIQVGIDILDTPTPVTDKTTWAANDRFLERAIDYFMNDDRIFSIDQLATAAYGYLWRRPTVVLGELVASVKIDKFETLETCVNSLIDGMEKCNNTGKFFSSRDLDAIGRASIAQLGIQKARLYRLYRFALTGLSSGPPVFHLIELFGVDETLERLRAMSELLRTNRFGHDSGFHGQATV